MNTVKSISSLKKNIRNFKARNLSIGFVPTMGALHEGHLSLLRKARRENDILILSIFVNPTQFGPHEDFEKYPREEKKDKLLAQKEKVDIIFYPSKETMYPTSFLTNVTVTQITEVLCGIKRKGHFQGVTTVVCKLLNLVEPDILYLGQKDYQQAIVITKMVEDLNINAQIKICPTVREKDGLALSSRNTYLTETQRAEAPILYRSLKEAKKLSEQGELNPSEAIRLISQNIEKNGHGKIEYIECVDAKTLTPIKSFKKDAVIALAVKFGKTRLIDNIIIKVNEKTKTQT